MSVSDIEAVLGENREFLYALVPLTSAFLFHKTGMYKYMILAVCGSFLPTALIVDKYIRDESETPLFEQSETTNAVVGITLILSWSISFLFSALDLFLLLNHEDWFMVLLFLAYIFLIVQYAQILLDGVLTTLYFD